MLAKYIPFSAYLVMRDHLFALFSYACHTCMCLRTSSCAILPSRVHDSLVRSSFSLYVKMPKAYRCSIGVALLLVWMGPLSLER